MTTQCEITLTHSLTHTCIATRCVSMAAADSCSLRRACAACVHTAAHKAPHSTVRACTHANTTYTLPHSVSYLSQLGHHAVSLQLHRVALGTRVGQIRLRVAGGKRSRMCDKGVCVCACARAHHRRGRAWCMREIQTRQQPHNIAYVLCVRVRLLLLLIESVTTRRRHRIQSHAYCTHTHTHTDTHTHTRLTQQPCAHARYPAPVSSRPVPSRTCLSSPAATPSACPCA
jgi:hypothetical protein